MIKNLDEVLQRLIDIHDCEEEMCGCSIHLLMAEIIEGQLDDMRTAQLEQDAANML